MAPDSATQSVKRKAVRRPAPPLRDKVRRAAWAVFYHGCFRLTPVPLHVVRRVLVRMFGGTVGPRAAIYPTAQIWAPWNIIVGEGATIGGGANLYAVDSIELQAFAVVSQGAHLCTASHDYNSESFDLITAPILIESNAWIAAEAFVGPGVTVAEGAVVVARSVVVKSVPPRTVVGGNPSVVLGRRDQIATNRLAGRVRSS